MAKYSSAEVQAALSGRRSHRVYPLPGAESVRVGVRMLSDEEIDAVRLQAQQFVKGKKCELVIDPEFFDRAVHRELVSRAFVDPDKPEEPFFGSEHELAEMDAAFVAACFELYKRHQIAMDPFAHCSREEVDELVELLGKAPENEELSRLFDSLTQWSFVLSMACVLREMRRPPKSATG